MIVCTFVLLRPDLWRFYTDGFKIRQPGKEAVLRQVLWEEPERMATHLNSKPDNYEPTISADGRTLIFSRGRASRNADLYLSHWDGESWGEPNPIEELNTSEDELGPELSRDGTFLYFYSNRKGGMGGYDIWLSNWEEDHWGIPVNMGEKINSSYNDYDPAISPSGRHLYLSSNRPKGELSVKERAAWEATLRESRNLSDYDIFESVVIEETADEVTPDIPNFGLVTRVTALNSLADEGQVSLTPRGDFLYFSSDREGGRGGFDIYRSRIFDGRLMDPENVGSPVNSSVDDMDPALWMEGYGLVFSSNRERLDDSERRFRIYHTLSREVISQTDLSAFAWLFEFLRLNKWWLLALLIALLAFIALLRLILNKKFRERLTLIQRCILGSMLLHLLIAFLLSLWLVSEAVYQAVTEPGMEIAINEGALSRERMALDIREQVTDLPTAMTDFEGQEQLERLPLPEIEPSERQLNPEPSPVSPPEFVTDVEIGAVAEAVKQDLEVAEVVSQLPALALTVTPPLLETPNNVAQESESEPAQIEPNLEAKAPEPLPALERSIAETVAMMVENSTTEYEVSLEREISVVEAPAPVISPVQPAQSMPPTKPIELVALATSVQMEDREAVAPEAVPSGVESTEADSALAEIKAPSPETRANSSMNTNQAVTPLSQSSVRSPILTPLPFTAAMPDMVELAEPVQSAKLLPPMKPFEPSALAVGVQMEGRNVVAREVSASNVEVAELDSSLSVVKAESTAAQSSQPLRTEPALLSMSHDSNYSSVLETLPLTSGKSEISDATNSVQLAKIMPPMKPFVAIALAAAVRMEGREALEPGSESPVVGSADTDSAIAVLKALPGTTPSNLPLKRNQSAILLPNDTVHSVVLRPLQLTSAMPKIARMNRSDQMLGIRNSNLTIVPNLLMEAPVSLSTPYMLRSPRNRERLIETLGGTDETEAAIKRSLDWLTRNQSDDGSWEVGRFGGRRGHRTAGTGLALLCYLGWGAKHNETGPYQEPVLRALEFLLKSMGEDGRLWRHGDRGMYDQGIASIALAEAYGVSLDPVLKEPVERSLNFILQSSRRGREWRYNPGDPGDTSVYGWQVMALKSGQLAGIDLPEGVLAKAGRWLDLVGGGEHGGIYGYTSKQYHGPGMVAEGMFCQQLLGIPRSDPRMIESAAHLAQRLPSREKVDFFFSTTGVSHSTNIKARYGKLGTNECVNFCCRYKPWVVSRMAVGGRGALGQMTMGDWYRPPWRHCRLRSTTATSPSTD